jgi:probable phosphoglycerate mutase
MERDLGALAGLTMDEVRERFADAARDRAGGESSGIPGFEEDEAFARRVQETIDAILEMHAEGVVAVVTHGGVIGSFLRQALEIPLGRRGPFHIENASITTVEVSDGAAARTRLQLTGLNDRCHLDGLAGA